MTQTLQSESFKTAIQQSRQRIAEAHKEIGRLQSQVANRRLGQSGWIDTRGHPDLVSDLLREIAGLEVGIADMERRLPLVEAAEQIEANIAAQNAKAQAEAEAQAKAERDQAMKQGALQRYLQSGGDPAQFEALWPGIRQQIATEQATQAASAALAAPTPGDQVQRAVSDLLASRYRHN